MVGYPPVLRRKGGLGGLVPPCVWEGAGEGGVSSWTGEEGPRHGKHAVLCGGVRVRLAATGGGVRARRAHGLRCLLLEEGALGGRGVVRRYFCGLGGSEATLAVESGNPKVACASVTDRAFPVSSRSCLSESPTRVENCCRGAK